MTVLPHSVGVLPGRAEHNLQHPQRALKIGVNLLHPVRDGVEAWSHSVRNFEAIGVDRIGVGDIQTLTYECYVHLGMLAVTSSTAELGPVISNPVTRHVGVAANGFATLQAVSNGRAFYGVGTGNSSVRNVGASSASLTALRDHVRAFRELVAAGQTMMGGKRVTLPWAPEYLSRPVPVVIAANGPASLQLAGQIADGVIFGGGVSDEVVQSALTTLETGARTAGRDPADLEVWVQADVHLGKMGHAARSRAADMLAAKASRNFRWTLSGKGVPRELEDAIRRFEGAYSYGDHVSNSGRNAQLLDELGLTSFLADLWLLHGDLDGILSRLKHMAALGVDGVHLSTGTMGTDGLTALLRDLVPALKAAT